MINMNSNRAGRCLASLYPASMCRPDRLVLAMAVAVMTFVCDSPLAVSQSSGFDGLPRVSTSGVATIHSNPGYIVLSVPLKTSHEEAEAAVNELRLRRIAVEQAARQMGCENDCVHSVQFRVRKETPSRSVVMMANHNGDANVEEPPYSASCLVLAIVRVNEPYSDPEDYILEAQERLMRMTSVLPPEEPKPADAMSYSAVRAAMDSLGTINPDFMFAAKVNDEDRKYAFQEAVRRGTAEATMAAEAMGVEHEGDFRISMPFSSASFSTLRSTEPTKTLMQRHPDLVFGKDPNSIDSEVRVMLTITK